MKKRIVLHAGLPKCGSSSLQFMMASNRDELSRSGIHYPDLSAEAAADSSIPLSDAMRTSHMLLAQKLAASGTASCELLKRIVDRFEASGCHTLLLSSESFVMRALRFKIGAFRSIVGRYDIETVTFVRRFDRWFLSYYKQSVKDVGRRYDDTLSTFVDSPPRYATDLRDFRITDRIVRLSRLLGSRTDRVYDLDTSGGDAVALLGSLLGVTMSHWRGRADLLLPYNAVLFEHGLPINYSLSDRATLYLAMFNRIGAGDRAIDVTAHRHLSAALLSRQLAPDYPKIDLLSPDRAHALMAAAAPDRSRLGRRFSLPASAIARIEPSTADHHEWLDADDWLAESDAITAIIHPDARAAFLRVLDITRGNPAALRNLPQ